ncbi:nuclear transport factor 2 family protein [Niveibacterium sp. SC-1]|uniref:YybH family protein n=1 Tax=Niveibacterium sp. SC-1 TaxID=3135646 RepID=UPI0031202144
MSPTLYATAEDVETAFYDAFNKGDIDGLMAVWSETDEVVCVHPGGSRLVGLHAIRESWKQLFESGLRLRLRIHHPVIQSSPMLTVRSVLQHVVVEGEDSMPPPIVATNVYARGPFGWRLVLHHASPSPDAEGVFNEEAPRVVH